MNLIGQFYCLGDFFNRLIPITDHQSNYGYKTMKNMGQLPSYLQARSFKCHRLLFLASTVFGTGFNSTSLQVKVFKFQGLLSP